jgi:hypothetical protein
MYWPGSTRDGSARKAFTTPQSIRGLEGCGAKSRSQSFWKFGPRAAMSWLPGRSLAQTSEGINQSERLGKGRLGLPIPFQPNMGSFSVRAFTKSFRPLKIPSRVSPSPRELLYGYRSN